MNKWKNQADGADISLHDCIVNKIDLSENSLSFLLDDGFWVLSDSKHNNLGETVRTDKAKIEFVGFDKDFSAFFIYKRLRLFGIPLCVIRKKVSIDSLFKRINNCEWEIELLEEYHSCGRKQLFFGNVNTKKRLWAYEFQLFVDCIKIEYYWNELCTDRKW